jgi:formate dehydrogenase iron-sulfur subunit
MDVCPVGAISKSADGTVKLDSTKCVGCKYCNVACPFEVPKYRPAFNVSNKCTLCDDRVAQEREPACVQTCPAAALSFGQRDEQIAAGKARVEELKAEGYTDAELYGVTEMGGMHVLHVAKYGLEAHGLMRDPKKSAASEAMAILKPLTGIGVAAVIGGLGLSFLTALGYDKASAQPDEPVAKGGE